MVVKIQDLPYISMYNTKDFAIEKKLIYQQPWSISQICVSSDQKYLAAGYEEEDIDFPHRIINIYEIQEEQKENKNQLYQQIQFSTDDIFEGILGFQIQQIEFQHNSETLIALYSNKKKSAFKENEETSWILIMNAEQGNILKKIKRKGNITNFYSLNSSILMLKSTENEISILNLDSDEEIDEQEYKLDSQIKNWKFQQDLAIFSLENSNTFIFDLKTNKYLLKESQNIQISINTKSQIIAFLSNNNSNKIQIIQRKEQEQQEICSIEEEESITSFKLSQNGQFIAVFLQKEAQLKIYDILSQIHENNKQGKLIQKIQFEVEDIQEIKQDDDDDDDYDDDYGYGYSDEDDYDDGANQNDLKKKEKQTLEYEFFNCEENPQKNKILVHLIKNNQIFVYNIGENNKKLPILNQKDNQILEIAYSGKNNLYATISKTGDITVIEGKSGKTIHSFKGQPTQQTPIFQFSPKGNKLFQASSQTNSLLIQHLDSKETQTYLQLEKQQQQQQKSNLENLIFSPCGTRFITLQTYCTQIWNIETLQKIGQPLITQNKQKQKALGFSSDKNSFSVQIETDSTKKEIISINLEDGTQIQEKTTLTSTLKSGKLNSEYAIQDNQTGFSLLDLTKTGKNQILLEEDFEKEKIKDIQMAENQNYFAVLTQEDQLIFYSMSNKAKIGVNLRSVSKIKKHKISQNGRYLAFQSNKYVQIWDIQENIQVLKPILNETQSLISRFSKNSSLFVIYFNNECNIVSTESRKIISRCLLKKEVEDIIISPDNEYLLILYKEETYYSLYDIHKQTIKKIEIPSNQESNQTKILLKFLKIQGKLYILQAIGRSLSYFSVQDNDEKEYNIENFELEETDFITEIKLRNETFVYIETDQNTVKIIDFSEKTNQNQAKIVIDCPQNSQKFNQILSCSQNLDFCALIYETEVHIYNNLTLTKKYSNPQIIEIIQSSISIQQNENILYIIAESYEYDYMLIKLGKEEPVVITNFIDEPGERLSLILFENFLVIEYKYEISIFDFTEDLENLIPKVYLKKEENVIFLNVLNGFLYIQYEFFTEIYDLKQNKTEKLFIPIHSNSINIMKFTPDSKYLLTGSQDETVIVWDSEKGKAVKQMKGFSAQIALIEISLDSKIALIGDKQGKNSFWDIQKGEKLYQFTLDIESSINKINKAIFSQNNEFCMTLDQQNQMNLWNLNGKFSKQQEKYDQQQKIRETYINQKYKRLAIITEDMDFQLFCLENGQEILKLINPLSEQTQINLKTLENNQKFSIIYQNDDPKNKFPVNLKYFLAVIDHENTKIASQIQAKGLIINIEISENQETIFINLRNRIQILNLKLQAQQEINTNIFIQMPEILNLKEYQQPVFSLSNENDDDMILTTQVFNSHLTHFNLKENKQCILPLYNENQPKIEQFLLKDSIIQAELSLKQNKLALATQNKVLIFDLETFSGITSFQNNTNINNNNKICSIKYHPFEDILVISFSDGALVIMQNKIVIKQLNYTNQDSIIQYSNDGQFLGHSCDETMNIYNKKGDQLYNIILKGKIITFTFSQNNDTLAISHNIDTGRHHRTHTNSVSIIDIKTQQILFVFQDSRRTANLLAFDKQQQNTLIIGIENQQQLEKRDLQTGKKYMIKKQLSKYLSNHKKYILSPDHEYFFYSEKDSQSLQINKLQSRQGESGYSLPNFIDYSIKNLDFKAPNLISTIRKCEQNENIANLWAIEQSQSIYQEPNINCQSVCQLQKGNSDFRAVWGTSQGNFTIIDGSQGIEYAGAFDLKLDTVSGIEGSVQDICINEGNCDQVACSVSTGRIYVLQKYDKLHLILKYLSKENIGKLKELGIIKGENRENYELDSQKYFSLKYEGKISAEFIEILQNIMMGNLWFVMKQINLNNQEQSSISAQMANLEGAKMSKEVKSTFLQKGAYVYL